MAAAPPASSTIRMIAPPCTLPHTLASGGCMARAITVRDSSTVFSAGSCVARSTFLSLALTALSCVIFISSYLAPCHANAPLCLHHIIMGQGKIWQHTLHPKSQRDSDPQRHGMPGACNPDAGVSVAKLRRGTERITLRPPCPPCPPCPRYLQYPLLRRLPHLQWTLRMPRMPQMLRMLRAIQPLLLRLRRLPGRTLPLRRSP